jgi:ABC-2 type transport system permease protein
MKAAVLLFAYSFRRARTLLLMAGILLAAFQLVLIAVGNTMQSNGGLQQLADLLPAFVRELEGPAFLSFAGIVCLGYFHPVPMGALIAISITLATIPASEVETGFADLILSRSVARHWIITRTIAITVFAIAALLALMMAGTWLGLDTIANKDAGWPSAKLILSLAGNLAMLNACWGGVAMAIGAASRRRGVAGGTTGMLALTAFLLDYVGRLWQPLESAARLSPFRYYNPSDLIVGEPLPLKNLVVLGSIAVAGFAAAYVLFARRDISK